MLSPLPGSSVRIVLLPSEPCLLPALVHRIHEVLAQPGEQIMRLASIRAFLRSDILIVELGQ